ncbi:4-alpha-glucanotransferase, putative [Eimeria mitis]|uniref:4-alpha-glucanotransferase n=1 Tax=Eimeria mitis TaxID=44415 RepID=U6KAE3_9EIME|nr:4-alpha-glucanotransferase, putative [Eimeria mitis]CDJ33781.1 4-alpha-glucanotransferase, putative [Eimeria mitis]
MDFMYEGRNAGVLLHLTSLPSKCGIVGDFGESAEPFLEYLKEAGFSYWQVLPVGPCTYSESQPGCPYLSTSSFALNPLLVCPVGLISLGLVTEEEVSQLVAKWQAKQQERRALNRECSSHDTVEYGDFVDYHAAKGYKDELLAAAYNAFIKKAPTEEYDEFCKANKFWLDGYVLFEAIQARHPDAASWLEWPEEYRSYRNLVKNESLLQGLEMLKEEQNITDKNITGPVEQLLPQFHRFVQFILSQQWSQLRRQANTKGIKILGDIAFYVNMHSSDAWSNSEMFQMDTATNKPLYVSGVPPDYFSAEGQLWGHPVYAWDAHERTNFSWWTRRLAKSFEKFDACRLDHFRGFESYWRVPYEFAIQHKSARDGEWVQGPGTKLFDAIFKNMGWENPRVNVATAYSEALSKHRKQPTVKERLANIISKHVTAKSKPLKKTSGAPHSFGTQGGGDTSSPAPLLIAEDLGFITPEIVALRDKYSIFSMRVMQFAWADKEKGLRCEHLPYNHTRDCVVYTGLREEPPSFAAHRRLAHLALLSVANLVILPVQDILGLDDRARFNLPGVDSPKNWSWKLSSLGPLYSPENLNPLRELLILSNRSSSSE